MNNYYEQKFNKLNRETQNYNNKNVNRFNPSTKSNYNYFDPCKLNNYTYYENNGQYNSRFF